MFLYAQLVTSNLEQQSTFKDLERELEPGRLPEGIKQA
jgi:hypothetical protein